MPGETDAKLQELRQWGRNDTAGECLLTAHSTMLANGLIEDARALAQYIIARSEPAVRTVHVPVPTLQMIIDSICEVRVEEVGRAAARGLLEAYRVLVAARDNHRENDDGQDPA
jgi:hypothetical protein